MLQLQYLWLRLLQILHLKPQGEIFMTVSATFAVTSTGSVSAPKPGDVLTATYTISGDGFTIGPGPVTLESVSVPVTGSVSGTLSGEETIGAPVVTNLVLTKPFVQQADPHVYVATV